MPNRAWSWPGMGDGLLVIGVTVLVLVLGALASDALRPERPMGQVAGNHSRPQPKIVPGLTPDAGTVGCQCTVPIVAPGHAVAHHVEQAHAETSDILASDGDRRRDFMVMSAMIGRRHAATALTLQPYQLLLSPEDSSAGVTTSVVDGLAHDSSLRHMWSW